MQPVFDLHGPLVEDEHRTCRDDKQDRDKLQTKFENTKYKDSLQNTNIKYILHNTKFKDKNTSSLWRKKEGRENNEQIPTCNFVRCEMCKKSK